MKRYVILLISVLFSITFIGVQAQGKKAEMFKKRIYENKVKFIKERIAFTSEEETAFFPVYEDYMNKKHEIKGELRKMRRQIRKGGDVDYEAYNDFVIKVITEEARLTEEYYQRFKKILPAKKIYKLNIAERDFKKELLDKVRQSAE